jgi:hypothetical protein
MATCSNDIHVDDIGTIFRLTVTDCVAGVDVAVDVSAQTDMDYNFVKPDDTILNATPVFTTDGTNGEIEYISLSGDIDQIGIWQLQAVVVVPAGTFHTKPIKFQVHANLA